MYVTYPATVAAAGAEIIRVPLVAERGFHLDLVKLATAVTATTRAILINSPHNPTGAVMTLHELEAVAELCRRHDLWLISDEVYAALQYDGEHVSPTSLPGMAERTVTISSVSKSHAMTGWRVGWLIGPPELVRHAANLSLCMLYGSPGFIQDAATVALTGDLAEVATMRERFRRRRDAVCRRLAGLPGLACTRPKGGMFVMLDVRRTGLSADVFAEGCWPTRPSRSCPATLLGWRRGPRSAQPDGTRRAARRGVQPNWTFRFPPRRGFAQRAPTAVGA